MAADWPKIVSRRSTKVSSWVEIIEREVEFISGGPREIYHAIGQQDYITIVARTPVGRIPIVRQYRPAVEQFTWELPAGMVEKGEPPGETCARELLEETGYPARAVHALGEYAPCTARLSNRVHSFFVETGPRTEGHRGEAGIEVRLVTLAELGALILSGAFTLQLHVGALLLAGLAGHLDLGTLKSGAREGPTA
jgi:8-oxo-dGTP pyrophosphatase MutT (NUDIX family)